jgi:hypothetical protein
MTPESGDTLICHGWGRFPSAIVIYLTLRIGLSENTQSIFDCITVGK